MSGQCAKRRKRKENSTDHEFRRQYEDMKELFMQILDTLNHFESPN